MTQGGGGGECPLFPVNAPLLSPSHGEGGGGLGLMLRLHDIFLNQITRWSSYMTDPGSYHGYAFYS